MKRSALDPLNVALNGQGPAVMSMMTAKSGVDTHEHEGMYARSIRAFIGAGARRAICRCPLVVRYHKQAPNLPHNTAKTTPPSTPPPSRAVGFGIILESSLWPQVLRT